VHAPREYASCSPRASKRRFRTGACADYRFPIPIVAPRFRTQTRELLSGDPAPRLDFLAYRASIIRSASHPGTPGPPGSSRRAGGFSLVLPPTTADAGHRRQLLAVRLFHRPKRLTFGTRSSPQRKFLAGRRADGLRAAFTRSSPQDSQVQLFGLELFLVLKRSPFGTWSSLEETFWDRFSRPAERRA
jgi:hypothetical protein